MSATWQLGQTALVVSATAHALFSVVCVSSVNLARFLLLCIWASWRLGWLVSLCFRGTFGSSTFWCVPPSTFDEVEPHFLLTILLTDLYSSLSYVLQKPSLYFEGPRLLGGEIRADVKVEPCFFHSPLFFCVHLIFNIFIFVLCLKKYLVPKASRVKLSRTSQLKRGFTSILPSFQPHLSFSSLSYHLLNMDCWSCDNREST